ncbi:MULTISPECIES: hypothetical protein [Achromobacter]|uniref:Uncharacterized protein n=1 Tax=Achromobacter mucicolens TaxID=1389922 RepID=A0ABM8LK83_9BURK|nr:MULTISPECIES: hypothetical protein [Achromobacter]AVG44122.1 hypothetical protein MC81_32080 [Achromobacter insolitus]CAB3847533.1 hypothetical protein LMG3410_01596 [Achromobacter aegrifaciens]CAB3912590.1 hypothetical protein LMG3415_05053 [Achromobacter mucicolens]
MAIITSRDGNRPTDYVQLTFGTNAKAPLGMALPNRDYTEFTEVPGIGGRIRHVNVRTKPIPTGEIETCTLYFEDEGQERGTALQFTTGGPDGYSFAAGHLVAKLLACRPDDEIRIMAHVFKEGSSGTDRHTGQKYVRQKAELAVPVYANDYKIQQPNWGVDGHGNAMEKGPEAPFIVNPSTGKPTNQRDFTEAREWMSMALRAMQISFNRRSQAEVHQDANSAPISADDLPDYVDGPHHPAEPDQRTVSRGHSSYEGQRG